MVYVGGLVNFVPPVSQTLEGMTYFGTPSAGFRFQMCCFVSKPEHVEADFGSTTKAKFQNFHPRVKIRGVGRNIVSQDYRFIV